MIWLAMTSEPPVKCAGPQFRNGELLALAAAHFDVFVTVDRNLSFQQNIGAVPIAVIVVRSRSNRLSDLRLLVPELLAVIPRARPGAVAIVGTVD